MGVPTSSNDFKNGMTLDLPDGLFAIVEFQHVKPGKGGAFVRTKLKNLKTKAVIDRTYRGDEKVDQAIIEKHDMQYLYRDGESYVFMDNSSYDQISVSPDELGSASSFIKEGDTASVSSYQDVVVGIELSASANLTVTNTEPGIQGDRVSGARKPATLETGFVLQVPLFIEQGEKITVDTRTGEYISRA